jgi:nucleotide-binding universal stress UspA family protein
MFERILIPLDGSPRAELILSQIGRILRREDSELLLLRVVDIPQPVGGLEASAAVDVTALRRQEREAAQKYLHDMTRRFAEKGAKVNGRVVEGPAAQMILDASRDEGATMIAMTTHGRAGVARWVMGSVAEKVARASGVPLLLVRSFRRNPHGDLEPISPEEFPFRRILVPVDGSPTSMSVIAPAGKFAQLFGSEILLLHVRPPDLLSLEAGLPPPPISADKDETTAKAAERFGQAGLKTTRITVDGEPASEIVDQSAARGVDLIAMASHGRSGLSRWALGSVAERVLRSTTLPLLVVPTPSPRAP